jgi:hypothetical protein
MSKAHFIEPMLLLRTEKLPDGPGWVHELKFDGHRALAGASVCRVHGGSAPQVLAAARRRLLAACDPAAARLDAIARSKKSENRDAIAAAREILDRAGLLAERPGDATSAGNGTVLWEEFVALHRRVTQEPRTNGAAAEKKDAPRVGHST